MKNTFTAIVLVAAAALAPVARATQADESTIVITGQAAGATPFISKLSINASNPTALANIKFTITPKPGTISRPLAATYAKAYLSSRGYFDPSTGDITVPVFGLYANYANTVTLAYRFADGSSKQATVTIATQPFDDACEFNNAIVRQPRSPSTELSYDFILVSSRCGTHSPTIIDTDGKVRWVGTSGVLNYTSRFYRNGIYLADGPRVLRMELDGDVSVIGDYSSVGAVDLHHNIDLGKSGLVIDINTLDYVESTNLEIDPVSGDVLKRWDLAEIIKDEMIRGGDDPTGFVRNANGRYDFDAPGDWFHNNSTTYRRFDNTLILSSRENFVIAINYDTKAIKWILGDTTKKWYQYASLRKLALTVADGGLAPVGQHALSIGKDRTLLLMDNGQPSQHQFPAGPRRASAPRKYKFDLPNRKMTQVWSFPNGGNNFASYCSSVYEDAAGNYLVDYANTGGRARILGVARSGEKAFEYAYPTAKCEDAYRSLPVHWENLVFSAPGVASRE
ncbi:MAG: aryl-sulfate sulfotransferase [Chthoniobacterales bacterium]